MPVSKTIVGQIQHASWIRRMFEEGIRLKAERGADKVFDFTLGNPDTEPPPAVIEALCKAVEENRLRSHAYMPNAGFPEVREIVARRLERQTGLPFTGGHILMTVGAAGAINTVLRSMLDRDDEVIVLAPWFSEYQFYIANHGGVIVEVQTDEQFQPDVERIAAAITPRTRAIILNSPNNPSGAVYSAEVLARLNELLRSLDHPVTVISDEPYKALVFDGRTQPEVATLIERTVIANSWSKEWAVPGERIGYLAISPRIEEWKELADACTFAQRVLGYVNAPAIWQWVVAGIEDVKVDVRPYQERRDLLCAELRRIGYQLTVPQGAFYLFPKTPIADDVAFVRILQKQGVLAVPGSGFGRPGHIRLSLTVTQDTIERSVPGFAQAFAESNR